jgi:hypothetical protein
MLDSHLMMATGALALHWGANSTVQQLQWMHVPACWPIRSKLPIQWLVSRSEKMDGCLAMALRSELRVSSRP